MVEEHFDFLVERGFRLTDVDYSTWTISVTYGSATSAVQVSKSNEFIRSEVHLVRLVDGKLPPYPIWVTEARIDWTLLDNVLEARAPGLLERSLKLTGSSRPTWSSNSGFGPRRSVLWLLSSLMVTSRALMKLPSW